MAIRNPPEFHGAQPHARMRGMSLSIRIKGKIFSYWWNIVGIPKNGRGILVGSKNFVI
jgi:hypothetical protein